MNPFCPKCNVPMNLKTLGHAGKQVASKGRSKFWVCDKCGRRYRAGRDAIY